jgi:uncharacterized protein DUF3485
MQRSILLSATAVLLFGTIGIGVLHGRLSNRWGPQRDSNLAARRLADPLPTTVGQWKLRREAEVEEAVLSMLQCPAYVSRIYDHQQTGDVIAVAVLVGPPGPISVHTPEICYSSRDYALAGQRTKAEIVAADGRSHSFWKVALDSKQPDATPLEVLYGWSTGTQWQATERPRYAFGGLSHLYKLQLAASVSDQRNAADFDPVQDFLMGFLDQLQPLLVESSQRSSFAQ